VKTNPSAVGNRTERVRSPRNGRLSDQKWSYGSRPVESHGSMSGARSTWLAMRFSTPDGRGENASDEPTMRQRSDVPGTRTIDIRHGPRYRSPEHVARWSIPEVEEGAICLWKTFRATSRIYLIADARIARDRRPATHPCPRPTGHRSPVRSTSAVRNRRRSDTPPSMPDRCRIGAPCPAPNNALRA